MQEIFKNKRTLYISILVVVIIAIVGSLIIFRNQGEEVKAADWFDESYYYRKTIEIGNATTTLTDFQVKVLADTDLSTDIDNGKIQSDLDDLRFTDKDGNELYYWIEDKTATTTVNAWVKIPTFINGTSTVYMYYGNPSAEDGAQGSEVFLFFDDFNGNSLDTNKWSVEVEGSVAVTDSYVYPTDYGNCLNDGAWYGPRISADLPADMPGTFVVTKFFELEHTSDNTILGTIRTYVNDDGDENGDGLYMYHGDSWSDYADSNVIGQSVSTNIYNPGRSSTWDDFNGNMDLRIDGANAHYFINNTEYGTPQTQPSMTFSKIKHWFTRWCYASGWRPAATKNYLYAILIRKYSSVDPVVISPVTEEQGPGPVGYWSFDEGYGSTAYDQTPNNNNGTITNAVWKDESECKFGKCLYFDGSGDYVDIADDDVLDITDAVTIEFWAKVYNTSAIIAKGYQNYEIRIKESLFDGYVGIDTGTFWYDIENFNASHEARIDHWNHYVVVFDYANNDAYFYSNGLLKQTGSHSDLDAYDLTRNLQFGRRVEDGSANFNGYLDEVKIYNYARSADQIKQDYNDGASVSFGSTADQGLSDGLVAWWKMDETTWDGTQGEVIDSSGNGNHGTSTNAVTTSTAKFNYGGYFDGSSAYLTMHNTDIDLLKEQTIAFWVKKESDADQRLVYHGNDSASSSPKCDIGFTSGGYLNVDNRVYLDTDHQYDFTTSNAYSNNQWYHVVVVQGSGGNSVYVDGLRQNGTYSVGNENITGAFGHCGYENNPIYIGAWMQSGAMNSYFDGWIDDFRIYNRSLKPFEIRRLSEWEPGPVAYYKMDEHTGTSNVYDVSGNGNDATISGTMPDSAWVKGVRGSAIKFDGGTYYLDIPNQTMDKNNAATTFWFKVNKDHTFLNEYMSIIGDGGSLKLIGMYNNDLRAESDTNSDYWVTAATGYGLDIKANQWYHWAVSARDGTIKSYINGRLHTTNTPTDNFSPGFIGIDFDGVIDDVKIYDYGISQRQILKDMNAGKINNPIAYWSFDEGQGTTAYDYGVLKNTGNENNGTLTNMSTSGTSSVWTKYGKSGSALDLDGVDDYVALGSPGALDNLFYGNFSASAWVYIPESHGNLTLFSAYPGSYANGWHWRISGSNTVDAGAVFDGTNLARGWTTDTVDVGWNYLSMIYDSATKKVTLYKNLEVLKGGTDTAGTGDYTSDAASNKVLSNWWSTGTSLWPHEGMIDEFKIYNYKLTLDEMRQNYNQGKQITLSKSQNDDVKEGLVGWWKMDEDSWSATSEQVIDYSGAENHGTPASGTNTTSTAKYGRAGHFNGSSDFINLNSFNITGEKAGTVEMWFKFDALDSNYHVLLDNRQFFISRYGANIRVDVHADGDWDQGSSGYTSNKTFTTDTWYHLALAYDSDKGGYSTYYDGVFDRFHPFTGVLSKEAAGSYLGSYYTGAGYFFDGQIDDVKIYNNARSADQIMRDYVEGPPPIGHWKFDEKSGSNTVDSSGMGNDGTITNATWQSAADCKKGSCLYFDGDGDYVENTSITPDFDEEQNVSVSLWFKANTVATNQTIMSLPESGAGNNGVDLTLYTTGLRYQLATHPDSSFGDVVQTGVTANEWHHAVYTYDGTTLKGYYDGVPASSPSHDVVAGDGIKHASADINIGRFGSFGFDFDGLIDDVKIYNYALTARQVAQEYNEGKPIGHWKFDKGEGGTAYDYSGNGNDGTIYPGTSGDNTTTSTMWSSGETGKINRSMDFDGTDDWVRIPDPGLPTGDFTYSVWVNLDTTNDEMILEGADSASSGEFRIDVGSGLVSVHTNSYDRLVSTQTLSTDQWYHIVASREGSVIKLYINGKKEPGVGSDGTAMDFTSCPFIIGMDPDSGCEDNKGNWANGQIDEVKVWNYALTPEEIKKDFNGGFGTFFK